jgi:hypothetical protein
MNREAIDLFMKHYLAAMWFTECPEDDLAEGVGRPQMSEEMTVRVLRDCTQFVRKAWVSLPDNLALEQAGHDFWLTRNGHGAGFWDGDWPESGDELTALSHRFGEVDVYVGDDGFLYQSGGNLR